MTKKPKVLIVGGGRHYGKTLEAQKGLLEELESYRAIGTVSEFRELKEKAKPNKPYYVPYDSNPNIGNWHCPTCHGIVLYYHRVCGCGKHLDWS